MTHSGPDGAATLRIAGTVSDSIVDGPGLRYVVFTQGCTLTCAGCHNPGTQPLDGGAVVPVADLVAEMLSNPLTMGLTISGGEATLQPQGCTQLARAARQAGLSVWCYSGFTFEALLRRATEDPNLAVMLGQIDVLVDGPYVRARRSLTLPWRGSANQRLIDVQATLFGGSPPEQVLGDLVTAAQQPARLVLHP